MYAFIEEPHIIYTKAIEKDERVSRRGEKYCRVIIAPRSYGRKIIDVDEMFWSSQDFGRKMEVAIRKNILGLNVIQHYKLANQKLQNIQAQKMPEFSN